MQEDIINFLYTVPLLYNHVTNYGLLHFVPSPSHLQLSWDFQSKSSIDKIQGFH